MLHFSKTLLCCHLIGFLSMIFVIWIKIWLYCWICGLYQVAMLYGMCENTIPCVRSCSELRDKYCLITSNVRFKMGVTALNKQLWPFRAGMFQVMNQSLVLQKWQSRDCVSEMLQKKKKNHVTIAKLLERLTLRTTSQLLKP